MPSVCSSSSPDAAGYYGRCTAFPGLLDLIRRAMTSSGEAEYRPLARVDRGRGGKAQLEGGETTNPTPNKSVVGESGGMLGIYQPDRSRKISRLPAYMEVLREAERRELGDHHLCKGFFRHLGQAYRTIKQLATGMGLGKNVKNAAGSAVVLPSHEEIVQTGRLLCREYVNSRLKRLGLLNMRKTPTPSTSSCTNTWSSAGEGIDNGGGDGVPESGPTRKTTPSAATLLVITSSCALSDEVQAIGADLERMYPDLYRNVSRQLNITMSNEEVVRKAYNMFAEQLTSGGQMHWGKMIALFAMAGAFAIDCAQQGHPEFVPKVVDAFTGFLSRNLVAWISRQGGWVISDVIRSMKVTKDYTWFWIIGALATVIAFLLTLLFMISI